MANVAQHREKLIQAAVRLFREKGYASTGLSEILKLSGAPKGSLYYYFPEGKEQLAEEAVQTAGRVVAQTLRELVEKSASGSEFVAAYCDLLAGWMQDSGFKSGCPITTTVLETVPGSARLTKICQGVFNDWIDWIAQAYRKEGWPDTDAKQQAEFVIACIEGALIQARVQQSSHPITHVAQCLKNNNH